MGLTQTQISQLYISVFGRASEGDGSEYWMNDQNDMATAVEVMLATDAAKEYFGTALDTNQAFIEYIYENTLGKTYADDPVGIDFWAELLDGGVSKGQIVANLIEAAQEPGNAGDAQDQFFNKTLVSNYVADKMATYTDQALFEDFISGVDGTEASVAAAMAKVDAQGSGKGFILTTGVDLFDGTSHGDIFIAPSGTLGPNDNLIDTNNDDSDVLNVSLAKDMDGVNEPVIQKIETINVTYDHLSGAVTAFDASNVVGANINMLIGRAIDGTAMVVDAGMNNVGAGEGVETLIVTNVANGVVDVGGATTLVVDDAETDSNRITITVYDDLDLKVTTGAVGRLTINSMAPLTLNLASSEAGTSSFFSETNLIFNGAFELLVNNAQLLDGLVTTDQTGQGDLVAQIRGNASVDAVGWSFDRIILSTDLSSDGAAILGVKNNQTIVLDNTQTETTILENESETLAATINVSTGEDHTSLLFGSTDGIAGAFTVNLNATSTIALGNVTDMGAEGTLVITGDHGVTIGASDFANVDASGLIGEFDFTAGADTYITGSATKDNSVDVGAFDVIFQGGKGVDLVDARAAETVTIITALDYGDDLLMVDDTLAGGKVTVDFGPGTDTLWLGNNTELSGVSVGNLAGGVASTHSWSNLERIELENISSDGDTVRATVNGSDVSGKTIEIFTDDAADVAELGIYGDSLSTDLSGLTLTNIDSVFILGSGEKQSVIVSTAADDTIDTGNGSLAVSATITTGTGDDTVVFDHLGSGVSAKDLFDGDDMVSLTDYSAAEESLDNDILDLPGELAVLTNISLTDGLDLADATDEVETKPLYGIVTDGILTLDDAGEQTINMNTLAEWVTAASLALDWDDTDAANYDVVAFEYNDNTYVVTHDDSGGALYDATIDNVIELMGLKGVIAVSDIAGADTILIA